MSLDAAGKSHNNPSLASQLSPLCPAPIFGLVSVTLGFGIVGGSLINYEMIGERSGDVIIDYFRDPDLKSLPTDLNVPPVPMFDWRQLKRFGLSLDALPEDSIVRNQQLSLWEQYRWQVIFTLTALMLQGILIAALLNSAKAPFDRRRRFAEK
jgi:hypothetical protein